MKAVVMTGYGGPEMLELVERTILAPEADEVLIRVTACGVNPADGKWRQGMFAQVLPLSLPHVLGYDVAGTVESGGHMSTGTRVFAMLDNLKGGGYAEYAVAPADSIARVPNGVDDVTAAALPTAALTGLQLIEEHVDPKAGDVVLVTGALGAVGRFALHAAKARGARVVAGVRSAQVTQALAIGADAAQVLGMPVAEGLRFDHIADTVGGHEVAALCHYARVGARIRTVSTTPIVADGLPSVPVFIAVRIDACMLDRVAGLVASGRVTLPIARIMRFAEASEAHRLLDSGSTGGKIVLRPGNWDGPGLG